MENTQIFEMADRLKSLQEQKKDLEAQTKALAAEIAELDEQLSDAMSEAELDRFSRNGSTFYLKSRLFASPASGRKDEMMQALKENGYGSLVVETVNANTLASFIKEQREARETMETCPKEREDLLEHFIILIPQRIGRVAAIEQDIRRPRALLCA